MNVTDSAVVFPLLLAVQLLGLFSAWLARLSEGSSRQTAAQRLFFVSLGLVGVATLVSLGLRPGDWLSSAVVLSVMVVGTVCDFQPSDRTIFEMKSESADPIF
ncbi:MAG TPA: hypothetical protein VE890_00560 [Thermoguttaceae bacterium]|nr:hypothetical protein [Thermoguttaceae bacterium]